jgi:hypothetical protein
VDDRVHRRGLAVAGQHEALAARRLEIGANRLEELRRRVARHRRRRNAWHVELRRQRAREALDVRRLQRQAVISARAAVGRRALDGVETVARAGVLSAAARRERACMPQAGGADAHEVGVEREDDVGLLHRVLRRHVLVEGEPAALAGVVAEERLPLHHLGGGQAGEDVVDLRPHRRRRDRLGEDPETRALLRELCRQHAAHRDDEPAERLDVAEVGDRGRAVGVVETEDRRLRKDVRGAAARRVIRVAFDLRRPAFVALDQQTHPGAGKRHRGGVEQRLARHELFGLTHVRHELFGGLARARADAGQRERCRHQLQEAAATDGIEPLGGVLRELAVQELLELRRARQRFEASPVFLATRAVELGAKRVDVLHFTHERLTGGTSSNSCCP